MHGLDIFSTDLRPLFLVWSLCQAAQACVLLHVWKIHRNFPPAREWGAGALISALGLTLLGLRAWVPPWCCALLANGLLLAGMMVFNFGIVRATGGNPPWRRGAVLCALALGLLVWFTLARDDYAVRVVVLSGAAVAFDLLVIRACLTSREATLASTLRLIAAIHALLAASVVWRAVGGVIAGADAVAMPTLSQAQFVGASIVACVVLTTLLVLLTSQLLQKEVNALARQDPLTKAANRMALDEMVRVEWPRGARHHNPVSCLLLDVDHFKRFNDEHGHLAGDAMLRAVSDAARAQLRTEDVWARYGGEEFVALLPQTDIRQACAIAQRLRQAVAEASIKGGGGPLSVTVSIGAAECNPAAQSWQQLVALADQALYLAKRRGRDRVEVAIGEAQAPPDLFPDVARFVRLEWDSALECGDAALDAQHREIFATANKLLSAVAVECPEGECRALIGKLMEQIRRHFSYEEMVLRAAGYPMVEEHARSHRMLVSQASELAERFERRQLSSGQLFTFLLDEVVSRHMLASDHEYFGYLGRETRQ
ncbi:diguanylate cyclase [Fundidesulfovibrio agrisoli]|uniref:diguanylate cyclase n=1 Tax=Fundidesulfovibrio agrisoli TaxID=2922717 RepID=UPI001FACBC3C|nr:diguanylate cyclase [Fundidesulfovibrio agrisoli]